MSQKSPSAGDTTLVCESRRSFFGRMGKATIATVAGMELFRSLTGQNEAHAAELPPQQWRKRANQSYRLRQRNALLSRKFATAEHPTNGDEERYANKIASYSKGLPHNELGEVDLAAYEALVKAVCSGRFDDVETIVAGGTVKQANPLGAFAFDVEGGDSHGFTVPAPPEFASAWQAGEMVELDWSALTRDVPFNDYPANPLIAEAAADLSRFSDFPGPRAGGAVNADTLFRGNTPGDLSGPYISQFLWKNIPFGATTITQRYRNNSVNDDYMTAYADWLAIQRGFPPVEKGRFETESRYIRNGRDLSTYLRFDFSYQAFISAALILLSYGRPAIDPANPYGPTQLQGGFITGGGPMVLDLVARVANSALKTAWFQKWLVHRRLRPEAFGGRVHNHVSGAASYPIHADLLNSTALGATFSKYGSYLLPQAYPEGSPLHPSYPAGHAAIAGACVTVLKALFNEDFVIPDPVFSANDGLALQPYSGPALTVAGELNKLAANISFGRDTAGVHYRSDGSEGIRCGEECALAILRDHKATWPEEYELSLTRFDGTAITI
jgi:hypothetical protein